MKIKYSNNKNLVERLKKGNENAYAYLVDTYHHELCVYAGNLSRDNYKAEDIVQNVFLKVWKNRNNLKSNFSIKNFLYRSVYNEFIDLYRKNIAVTMLEKIYIETLNAIEVEEDATAITDLITLVKKEIQSLPPKCKQIFLMSKQDGLTNIEIAKYLKVSVKTVEAQMTKSFSIIRKKVGKKMHTILFLLFGLDTQPFPLFSSQNS